MSWHKSRGALWTHERVESDCVWTVKEVLTKKVAFELSHQQDRIRRKVVEAGWRMKMGQFLPPKRIGKTMRWEEVQLVTQIKMK